MAEINATTGARYNLGYVLGATALTAALAVTAICGLLGGSPAALGLTAGAAVGVIVVLDAIADLRGR